MSGAAAVREGKTSSFGVGVSFRAVVSRAVSSPSLVAGQSMFTAQRGPRLLARETPEEECDPAPDVHRMLVALRRCEYLAFDLADLGAQALADAAPAVRFNLRARRWFEVFTQLPDLLSRERQPHGPLRDLRNLLGRHIAGLSKR